MQSHKQTINQGQDQTAAMLEAAQQFMDEREYSKAIKEYTKLLEINPTAETHLVRGHAYIMASNNLKEGVSNKAAREKLIKAYVDKANEDFKKAASILENKLSGNTDVADRYLNALTLSSAYHFMNDFPKALETYNLLISLSPKNSQHYQGRSKVHLALGNAEQSKADLTSSKRFEIEKNIFKSEYLGDLEASDDLISRIFNAHVAFQEEKYTLALMLLNQAIRFNEHSVYPFKLRSSIYRQLGNNQELLNDLLQVAALEPTTENYFLIGEFYYDLSQREPQDAALAQEAQYYFSKALVEARDKEEFDFLFEFKDIILNSITPQISDTNIEGDPDEIIDELYELIDSDQAGEALALAETVKGSCADEGQFYQARAEAYFELADFEACSLDYSLALLLEQDATDWMDIFFKRLMSYLNAKCFELAQSDYLHLAELVKAYPPEMQAQELAVYQQEFMEKVRELSNKELEDKNFEMAHNFAQLLIAIKLSKEGQQLQARIKQEQENLSTEATSKQVDKKKKASKKPPAMYTATNPNPKTASKQPRSKPSKLASPKAGSDEVLSPPPLALDLNENKQEQRGGAELANEQEKKRKRKLKEKAKRLEKLNLRRALAKAEPRNEKPAAFSTPAASASTEPDSPLSVSTPLDLSSSGTDQMPSYQPTLFQAAVQVAPFPSELKLELSNLEKSVLNLLNIPAEGLESGKVAPNYLTYLVGGVVFDRTRELLLNYPKQANDDIDFVTEVPLEKVMEIIKKAYPYAKGYKNPYIPNLASFNINGVKLDIVSKPKLSPLYKDAELRDFAPLYLGLDQLVKDPTGFGIVDLLKGRLRTVAPTTQSFQEDPIRILRAIYQSTKRNLEIHKVAIVKNKHLISQVDPGYLNSWIKKLFSSGFASVNYKKLSDFKILEVLFPSLKETLKENEAWLSMEMQETSSHPRPSLHRIYASFIVGSLMNKEAPAEQEFKDAVLACINECPLFKKLFMPEDFKLDTSIEQALTSWKKFHQPASEASIKLKNS